LGYRPKDTSEPFETDVLKQDPVPEPGSSAAEAPAELTLGGMFSEAEYVGSSERLKVP
jgi:hypothetical protein